MTLKKSLYFFPITISLLIQSCTSSQQGIEKRNYYEDAYISFNYPENFILSNVDTSQAQIKMYSIEENLEESSFILSITIDNEEQVTSMIKMQKNLLNQYIPDAKSESPKAIEIENLKGLEFEYSFSKVLTYKGTYQSLKCDEASVGINYQYSLDEENRILTSTIGIIKSISCK